MMNAKSQLKSGVFLRFADYIGEVGRMSHIIRHFEASAWELVADATALLELQQDDCVTEEDVRQLLRGMVMHNVRSEQDRTELESLLDLLFQQAKAQTERCDEHRCRCRPRLDPGGAPLPPDDRDLDEPW